jgi:hypothetical protein
VVDCYHSHVERLSAFINTKFEVQIKALEMKSAAREICVLATSKQIIGQLKINRKHKREI